MGLVDSIYDVFHPGWFMAGIGVGLAVQILGWATGFGILAGLTGYVVMGILVGWASPGNTVVEPGVAAFLIATIGFVLDHLFLSILGIGVVAGVGYGLLGLLLGMVGGWIGERIQG